MTMMEMATKLCFKRKTVPVKRGALIDGFRSEEGVKPRTVTLEHGKAKFMMKVQGMARSNIESGINYLTSMKIIQIPTRQRPFLAERVDTFQILVDASSKTYFWALRW